jgi:hypothetical protein
MFQRIPGQGEVRIFFGSVAVRQKLYSSQIPRSNLSRSGGRNGSRSLYSQICAEMEYDIACKIYDQIEATDNELRLDLYRAATRYAAVRAEWHLSSVKARSEMDARRTAAHNALIDALNILARNLAKQGLDVSWRDQIGDDRKETGDFAVFLSARFGILAR